ncbi:MAG: hypothetical protein ABFC77_05455 [Thermoguttaceae bacterium]
MTITQWIIARLREQNSPYAPFVHEKLEWQFMPTDEEALLEGWIHRPYRLRIPKNGTTSPEDNDRELLYPPMLIREAGTSWWNWKDGVTEACFFDFDYGHGDKALDADGIAMVDQWAARLPYILNCASKGGKGRHWLVRLATPLPAATRPEHAHNSQAIKDHVSKDLGFDISPFVCSYGQIQYIYSVKKAK